MESFPEFAEIAPYLKHPLVLVGFLLLLFFGVQWALIKSGIIQPLGPRQGNRVVHALLRYGFIIAALIIILGFALEFSRSQPADLYRVRVTLLTPSGLPVEGGEVQSSVGGEIKAVSGGWEIDIPSSTVPENGKILIRAWKREAFLSGDGELTLGDDLNPTIQIPLTRKEVLIRGIVIDEQGNAVADAEVSVVGYGEESIITGADGNFVLPAHAADGQPVRLRAVKAGYQDKEQGHPAGDHPATLILVRR